jgi:hypothetical protein
MSEISRLKRITKSLLPSFKKSRERYYNFDDARMAITELALAIPADLLAKLLDSDTILDDFLSAIYAVEDEAGVTLLTDLGGIDSRFQPKVYVEDQRVAFSVVLGRILTQEYIFADYTFGEPYTRDVLIE